MKTYLIYYLFITLSIIGNSCSEAVKEEYSIISIVIAEVTAITTPTTDATPNYTFSSTESGAITYGGSCSSSTTIAISGNNTIILNSLSDGTYTDCTIKVSKTMTTKNSKTNLSGSLTITSFTITSVPEIFVIVGTSGTILKSTDNGSSWDNATSPTAKSLKGITFGNKTFVAVGQSGNILRSTDNGSSFDNATSPTLNYINAVTFLNNTFVGVGESGNIVRSTNNGSSWDNASSPTATDLNGVTFGNNILLGVGDNGNIVRSTNW
jgi:hypothetical protein